MRGGRAVSRAGLRETFAKSMDYWARVKKLLPAAVEETDDYLELAS